MGAKRSVRQATILRLLVTAAAVLAWLQRPHLATCGLVVLASLMVVLVIGWYPSLRHFILPHNASGRQGSKSLNEAASATKAQPSQITTESRPIQTLLWNGAYEQEEAFCFPDLVGLDGKTVRQRLLISTFPRYRQIEIHREGAPMTQDKQFYRLRVIVDQSNKVKRIQNMV